MKNYADLTKRGQVRRLRRLTQNALGKFGFKQYNLKLLQHLDNTTFKLECETGQYLVRVHRVQAHMPHRIESELAWLKALSRDTNIPVQEPHCSSDGKMVVIAEASCVPEAVSDNSPFLAQWAYTTAGTSQSPSLRTTR